MTQHRLPFVTAALGAAVLLAGCASGPGASSDTPAGSGGDIASIGATIAAPGEVHGQGTVLQVGDAAPQLCLGPIMESFPPQCSGPEITGWDWDEIEGEETSGDVTWGAYAVTGTWDGEVFDATSAIMLALYDPMPFEDPMLDPDNAGDTDPAELDRIGEELTESAPFELLTAVVLNGYVFVEVYYDDGSIQEYVDGKYLPDTVVVRSALKDVE